MFHETWEVLEVAEAATQVATVEDEWQDVGDPVYMSNGANIVAYYIAFEINDSGQCDIRIRHRFHPTAGDPYINADDADHTLTNGTNEVFVYDTQGTSSYVQLQARVTHHLGATPADFQVIALRNRK